MFTHIHGTIANTQQYSASPNTSSKVLPLASVYRLSVDVVRLAAYEADVLVGKVDRRKIVEKVDPVEFV